MDVSSSASRRGRFTPEKSSPYTINIRLDGPHSRFCCFGKGNISCPCLHSNPDSDAFQPAASYLRLRKVSILVCLYFSVFMGVRLMVTPASGYTSLYKQPAVPMSSPSCVLTASRFERRLGYTSMWLWPVAFVYLISLRWPFVLCTVLRGIVWGTCETLSEGFGSCVSNQLHGPQTFTENLECDVTWPTSSYFYWNPYCHSSLQKMPTASLNLKSDSHTILSLINILFLFCTHLVFQVVSSFIHAD
jgi:hypothetical protein